MALENRNLDRTGRGGRRRKQLPNEFVEKRRYRQLAEANEHNVEINRTEITKHNTGNQKYRRDGKMRKKTKQLPNDLVKREDIFN